MSAVNNWTISGRLGRDCEISYTASGKVVTKFSVALDIGWGERKHTLWVNCAAWGERWDNVTPYLLKGTQVVVIGEADLRTYKKKDGSGDGFSMELTVRELALMDGKREGEEKTTSTGGFREGSYKGPKDAPPARQQQKAPTQGTFADDLDDDIPF